MGLFFCGEFEGNDLISFDWVYNLLNENIVIFYFMEWNNCWWIEFVDGFRFLKRYRSKLYIWDLLIEEFFFVLYENKKGKLNLKRRGKILVSVVF